MSREQLYWRSCNCPCTHVIAGAACVSKLASAVVTCSIFSSATHSIVHWSSRRLLCSTADKCPLQISQVWQQFVFRWTICFGLLALINAVLTVNNVTRLSRLTDATSQCSIIQQATQSHRAVTLWVRIWASIAIKIMHLRTHRTTHTHTHTTHSHYGPLVAVHASIPSRKYLD